jgi:hypothetical protein
LAREKSLNRRQTSPQHLPGLQRLSPGHACENITDWSLNQFHTHYAAAAITKWDIFY